MSRKRVVAVGGVTGRASWPTTLCRLEENADVIADEARIPITAPALFRTRFNIVIRTYKEVTAIERDNRTIMVKSLQTGDTRDKSYDALALAPGAAFPAARKLPFAIVTYVITPALFDEIRDDLWPKQYERILQRRATAPVQARAPSRIRLCSVPSLD